MNTENQRQRELRTGVKAKYTAYLNELYIRINNDEIILMNELTSSYKIGKQASPILQSQKIIKKLSRNKFIWIGKKPNSEMVDMIIENARINSYEKTYPTKEIGQKEIDFKTPVTKPIETVIPKPVEKVIPKPVVRIMNPSIKSNPIKEEKKNIEFSIFWGLIKFQKS